MATAKITSFVLHNCGTINVFLDDGRQFTYHRREITGDMDMTPEEAHFATLLLIRREIRQVMNTQAYKDAVGVSAKLQVIKTALEGQTVRVAV